MGKKLKTASAVFTGVAATGGIAGFATAPALAAASTWNVTGGGHVTAHNSTGADIFTDTTPASSPTITCPVSHVKGAGSVPNGVSRTNPLGTVSSYHPGFPGATCSGPFGIAFTGVNTTNFNVSGSSSTNGVTHGKITNIGVRATGTGIVNCDFSVTGSASATYTNATGVLSVTGAHLHVTNVSGCAGLINSSDNATFHGPITITNSTGGHPQLHHNTS